jgi:hypothetical protein
VSRGRPVRFSRKEIDRRYREKNKAYLSVNRKARGDREKFGDYKKQDHCQHCGRHKSELKRLLVHHVYFDSCDKCKPRKIGKPGTCRKKGHQTTLCDSCHQLFHRNNINGKSSDRQLLIRSARYTAQLDKDLEARKE